MPAPTLKTYVYVDGFNLYYGALKDTPHKWLNLMALCREVLQPHHEIAKIRYFTALVKPRSDKPQQDLRQKAYIRALETLPNLTVHYGHFLSHRVFMPLVRPLPSGEKMAWVIRTDEKGSDVNLATYLLADGFRHEYEAAVVISNDSDLKTPIQLVRHDLKLPVGVINPQVKPSFDLMRVAKFMLPIEPKHLAASQFANTLVDQHGRPIHKPNGW